MLVKALKRSFRLLPMRAGAATLAFVLLAGAAAAEEAPLAFDTDGGDAWTFHKAVTATVRGDRCDEVAITASAATLSARPQAGHIIATLTLTPGDNHIEARCLKNGTPVAPPITQDWHVRLRDAPKAWIDAALDGSTLVLDGQASERAPARAAPIVSYVWQERPGNPAPLAGLPAHGLRVAVTPPTIDGEYRLTLTVTDASGRSDASTLLFRVAGGKPQLIDPMRGHAAWIDDAVIYGVVPSLFGRDGLSDVARNLDRLAALGVDTLWLAPVMQAPLGDFGYAVTDYFRVRASLGGEAALREVIAAAHQRGMHVILDFVPNHLSDQHPYFRDACARGRRSAYSDFFAQTANGEVAHYFDWSNLENLNYENDEVRQLVVEAFAYWVREFGVDGFRVDVAWGPRLRRPDFWPRWRAELKRINPDLLLIAEASARDPYFTTHGFDAAYDWTAVLGQWAWHDAFEDETKTVERLRQAIAAAPGGAVLRFLNNNDTGPRFVTRHGIARTRVAAALLLTLPGLPALYTGDEIGAAYEPYRDAGPISWDGAAELRSWYHQLIALRHAEPALRAPDLALVDLGPTAAENVLAYRRGEPGTADAVIVLLNFGGKSAAVPLATLGDVVSGPLVDLLRGETIAFDTARRQISIPAYGVRVLKAQRTE